jgi:(p)ppGpp synthase/HD superfamily hydrolase
MGFSEKFDEALAWAHQLHRQQVRKGSGVPYVCHLLGVSALVIEHGGTEEQAIAALLHDAGEDQGGEPTVREIGRRFGPGVEEIVRACSDALVEDGPKPPWRERKEAYLAHLKDAPEAAILVSLADKVNNSRSLVTDLREQGPAVFDKFKGGHDGTLWYYRRLVEELAARTSGPLYDDLVALVNEMHRLAE